ncbi:hypothetical protein [Trichlorobacter sp.]|uniref:hypothetical protein n=1 Tax=Trichlorobacter sp. TaxID=2911007 RepID=UPI002A370DA2|nr:hypothetical protein [Trichlorobacter sp.]MDY0384735.1 hypothetical protein [Trichlorobacter sp.]
MKLFFTLLFKCVVVFRKTHQRLFSLILSGVLGAKRLRVHPSAKIIGTPGIAIGANFYAGKDFWLEAVYTHGTLSYTPRIIIGDNVAVNDSVHIAATNYIEIGNNVLMASKIYISDHNHGSYSGELHSAPEMPPNMRPVSSDQRVVIEDNVWLGEFVAVLPGVTIGKGTIIGSNSVVSRSIPPRSIAVGAPAKVVKQYNSITKKWEAV